MTKMLRITSLAATVAALAAVATPAAAAPVGPNNGQNASATVRIVKPLTLEWVRDLDLGTVILNSGVWTGATVGISHDQIADCSNVNVTCSGGMVTAQYKVTGTNSQDVTINVGDVVMTNQNDGVSTLTLDVSSPGSFNLGNSGTAGYTFDLGGYVTVDAATADGTYVGTFDVTVEY